MTVEVYATPVTALTLASTVRDRRACLGSLVAALEGAETKPERRALWQRICGQTGLDAEIRTKLEVHLTRDLSSDGRLRESALEAMLSHRLFPPAALAAAVRGDTNERGTRYPKRLQRLVESINPNELSEEGFAALACDLNTRSPFVRATITDLFALASALPVSAIKECSKVLRAHAHGKRERAGTVDNILKVLGHSPEHALLHYEFLVRSLEVGGERSQRAIDLIIANRVALSADEVMELRKRAISRTYYGHSGPQFMQTAGLLMGLVLVERKELLAQARQLVLDELQRVDAGLNFPVTARHRFTFGMLTPLLLSPDAMTSTQRESVLHANERLALASLLKSPTGTPAPLSELALLTEIPPTLFTTLRATFPQGSAGFIELLKCDPRETEESLANYAAISLESAGENVRAVCEFTRIVASLGFPNPRSLSAVLHRIVTGPPHMQIALYRELSSLPYRSDEALAVCTLGMLSEDRSVAAAARSAFEHISKVPEERTEPIKRSLGH